MEMLDPHTKKESGDENDAWALSSRNSKGKEREVEKEDEAADVETRSIKSAKLSRGRLGLEVSPTVHSSISLLRWNRRS